VVGVQTARELAQACERAFDACDILLMAAAVADFRPRHPAARKLKKDAGIPAIELEATEDVLSALSGRRRPEQVLIGFAAEHGDGAVRYGKDKLERKGLDAIVINDISEPGMGFEATENEVIVVTSDGAERRLARAGKADIADGVLETVQKLLESKESDNRAVRADPDRAARV
jgi:phosphopantothenoylcysteine decarboxylase/phosphopantothenate--cysteine ligase